MDSESRKQQAKKEVIKNIGIFLGLGSIFDGPKAPSSLNEKDTEELMNLSDEILKKILNLITDKHKKTVKMIEMLRGLA